MDPLAQVTKAALLNDCTLFCAWSPLVSLKPSPVGIICTEMCTFRARRWDQITEAALLNDCTLFCAWSPLVWFVVFLFEAVTV